MNAHQIKSLAYALALLALGQPRLGAQTLTVLHTFTNGPDGSIPFAGLDQSGNMLYGTASAIGGTSTGYGTVFALHSDGSGFTNLHSFSAVDPITFTNSDGIHPFAGLVLSANSLYGVASGGAGAAGTVFKLDADVESFTTLYSFSPVSGAGGPYGTNSDGALPTAALVLLGDTLYGTTSYGGSASNGTVFRVNTDGTCFTNLHTFMGSEDGANPQGPLLLSGDTLFGTAYNGGSAGNGTLFRVNTDGMAFTNLHSFTAVTGSPIPTNSDGANPIGCLVASSNVLFGVAQHAGIGGAGVLFRINTDGADFDAVHIFTGDTNGGKPTSGLLLSGHTLYGTTQSAPGVFDGTVFKVNTDGMGFITLHTFTGGPDGANPFGNLVLSGGTLYGTTPYGGSAGYGVVFALNLAIPLDVQLLNNAVVLSWADPAFHLQAAPGPSGVYTNIPGATSPYTNLFTGAQMFFRLELSQ